MKIPGPVIMVMTYAWAIYTIMVDFDYILHVIL